MFILEALIEEKLDNDWLYYLSSLTSPHSLIIISKERTLGSLEIVSFLGIPTYGISSLFLLMLLL